MKIRHLIAFILLLAATSCASTRKSAEIDPTFVASESTWLYRDAEVVHRRLKPLERPQVRFEVEHAIRHADSVWVVVRVTIPHRSIRRGECFKAMSVLQAPEGSWNWANCRSTRAISCPTKKETWMWQPVADG